MRLSRKHHPNNGKRKRARHASNSGQERLACPQEGPALTARSRPRPLKANAAGSHLLEPRAHSTEQTDDNRT